MSSPQDRQSTRPPERRRLRWRKALPRILISGIVLTCVFQFIDVVALRDGWSRVRIGPWIMSLAGFVILHAASALKWRRTLSIAGATIPPRTALAAHGAGLFASLCLPSLIGGDVLRAGLAMNATKRRTSVVLGALADRLFDLAALGVLIVIGLGLRPDMVGDVIDVFRGEGAASSTAGVGGMNARTTFGVIMVVGASITVGVLGWFFMRRPLRRQPKKIRRRLVEVHRAVRLIRRRRGAAVVVFLVCIAIQAGFVTVNFGLGASLGLNMSFAHWLVLWPLAKIVAMMPISFGGLGVREAAFATLVVPFAPSGLAVVQSLVWQSVLIVGGIIGGVYWMSTGIRPRGDVDAHDAEHERGGFVTTSNDDSGSGSSRSSDG